MALTLLLFVILCVCASCRPCWAGGGAVAGERQGLAQGHTTWKVGALTEVRLKECGLSAPPTTTPHLRFPAVDAVDLQVWDKVLSASSG